MKLLATSLNLESSPPVRSWRLRVKPLDMPYPIIIGGWKKKTCASLKDFCDSSNKLMNTILALSVTAFLSSQGLSLMKKEPYEGPCPPIMENPEITIVFCTKGDAITIFSTCCSTSSVRSCEVPGGIATIPIRVPVSSVGTRVVGVACIIQNKPPMEATTNPMESQGRRTKWLTPFLYRSRMFSYQLLKALMKRSEKRPSTATIATAHAIMLTMTFSKVNSPTTIITIVAMSNSSVSHGGRERPNFLPLTAYFCFICSKAAF